jgi:GT2 family glycosyltransferase
MKGPFATSERPKKYSIFIIAIQKTNEQGANVKEPAVRHSQTFVSVVVPVFNGGDDLDRCLGAVNRSDWPAFECIVVDDASTDPGTAEIAGRHGAHLERLEQRSGPALARNAGVKKARGEVIFFTDADVLLHSDALGKAVAVLESEPDVAAVFGSYDDMPGHNSLLSRYRNLYHHWNHQIADQEASTFWTGCGAIRKNLFMEMGGFSSDYKRPSIEDIELGYRLRANGYRIRLLKTMFGTHLKRWRFWDMVRTDIFLRGVPWVILLRRHRSAPADLNLNSRARIATVFAALLPVAVLLLLFFDHPKAVVPVLALFLAALLCSGLTRDSGAQGTGNGWKSILALLSAVLMPGLALAWAADTWAWLPLSLVAVVVWAQNGFYYLLSERGGIGFAIAVIPLQLLFFMGCALSVPLGLLADLRQRRAAGRLRRTG